MEGESRWMGEKPVEGAPEAAALVTSRPKRDARHILEDITSLPGEMRRSRHDLVDSVVSTPHPSVDRVLNALPSRTVVADDTEQVLRLWSHPSRSVHQAIEIAAYGFDAACEVGEARIQPAEE